MAGAGLDNDSSGILIYVEQVVYFVSLIWCLSDTGYNGHFLFSVMIEAQKLVLSEVST